MGHFKKHALTNTIFVTHPNGNGPPNVQFTTHRKQEG